MKRVVPVFAAVTVALLDRQGPDRSSARRQPSRPSRKTSRQSCSTSARSCHRTGEVAPMTFLSYEDVRPWAKVIAARSWRARCRPGARTRTHSLKMRNDRSLSKQQIDTIVAWVDGGAPKGNDADLPPVPKFAEGWTAGREPDDILEMPIEFTIPAEGELGVQMFYSPVPFTEDRFAETLEIRPGNRASCTTRASSSSTSPKARRSSKAGW